MNIVSVIRSYCPDFLKRHKRHEEQYVIRGVVMDHRWPNTIVLKDAVVTLTSSTGRVPEQYIVTNNQGYYNFVVHKDLSYNLRFEAIGYHPMTIQGFIGKSATKAWVYSIDMCQVQCDSGSGQPNA